MLVFIHIWHLYSYSAATESELVVVFDDFPPVPMYASITIWLCASANERASAVSVYCLRSLLYAMTHFACISKGKKTTQNCILLYVPIDGMYASVCVSVRMFVYVSYLPKFPLSCS